MHLSISRALHSPRAFPPPSGGFKQGNEGWQKRRRRHCVDMAEMAATRWTQSTVAVVTGSNKTIGYEIVKGLAKAGMRVVLTARDENRGSAALKTLQAEGLEGIHFHQLAVDKDDSVKTLAGWLKDQFGGIDILVNNAGIAPLEVSYENAYNTLETNYWGVQKVTEGLLPIFKPEGLRRIVMVSSEVGLLKNTSNKSLRTQLGDIDNLTFEKLESLAQKFLQDVKAGTLDDWASFAAQYSASKMLLNSWTRVFQRSVASKKIAVNSVCPGYTRTDISEFNQQATRTPADGADTPVWLAALPTDNYPTGKFFTSTRTEVSY